ncbi:hypothetical protein ACQKWADRAFT_294751 [Trichoderma austrokoningii]
MRAFMAISSLFSVPLFHLLILVSPPRKARDGKFWGVACGYAGIAKNPASRKRLDDGEKVGWLHSREEVPRETETAGGEEIMMSCRGSCLAAIFSFCLGSRATVTWCELANHM